MHGQGLSTSRPLVTRLKSALCRIQPCPIKISSSAAPRQLQERISHKTQRTTYQDLYATIFTIGHTVFPSVLYPPTPSPPRGRRMGRVIDDHHHCYKCHLLAALRMRNDDGGHDYLLYIYIYTYISKVGRGCNWTKYSYCHSRHQLPQASPRTLFVMFSDAGKGVLLVMLATRSRSIRPLPQVVGFAGQSS